MKRMAFITVLGFISVNLNIFMHDKKSPVFLLAICCLGYVVSFFSMLWEFSRMKSGDGKEGK